MADVIKAKVVVIGSGPGGYSAAFRAADLLGEGVVLVERYEELGGVCLNVGCIPSKALLHTANIINETKEMAKHGVDFGAPKINLDKLRDFKNGVVKKLNAGLKQMAKLRKVNVVHGEAKFSDTHTLLVSGAKQTTIEFENVIIAAGSRPVHLPFLPKDDPRVLDSTGALELKEIPKKMLVVGGGIIGMEMATVYHALGSEIDVVELTDFVLPGVDKDIATPFHKFVQKRYKNIWLSTKVVKAEAKQDGIWVHFEGKDAPKDPVRYDCVLQSVGRIPNGKMLDAEKAGVQVDERGFIATDKQMRTNVPHIFAIGDIVGQPMLAHKAVPEGRLAAEVIAGKKHFFDAKCIPSVAYTDPEVAWVGLTEAEAKAQNIDYDKGVYPWAASGRAIGLGREEGLTKVIFCNKTHRVLGAAVVGVHAGDLISEMALAIEMGCEAEDLALTIHPHPTLSETLMQAAEVYEGTVTDLPNKKK
ncbi:dihydrolipoyl dehydrogenase [Candidatus Berkiella cookevillensis]|uniref:Dihydrolipoyl dehydrogenase n=1 Tax=Candidatus Berkiella cookevillensis TaxID=437022 RepID=A0A0Q9YME0_9GAMM|nr:dihydrolipoyl dehydrogenase [Candidatus Berkiella cookevillensis]MCS5708187.1 dihydrolipoyl dehydrogenase [Candidatus Berkiella cookevillensis]